MVNNVDNVDQRELQSLQAYLNEYRQQAEVFAQQLSMLEEGRIEAFAATEALSAILNAGDSTVLLQIGGGVSVRARVEEPDKILVNIGADVIVERSNSDAVEYLKDRITEMEASGKKVAEALDRIRTQMNEIARRLETGYRQAQQMNPPFSAEQPEEED
jgi:prefoldin, archaeal alpha subunit/eukaryotic subunit 5